MKPQSNNNKDILPILKYGNPLLRKKVRDVTNFNILPKFIKKMFLTIQAGGGIGLAANQVGKSINLLIVDTNTIKDEGGKTYIFINSKIIKSEGSSIMEEGCLSVPDIRAEIERPEIITLHYQDLEKRTHEKVFSGIISRVIQHEFEHLDGKFFVDYLSPSKRILIHKRLLEIAKHGEPSTGIIL